MSASFQFPHKSRRGLASTLFCGIFVVGLGFAAPAMAAGGDDSGGTGASAGSGASGGGTMEKKAKGMKKPDLPTCAPCQFWDKKPHKCLERHSGVFPDPDLTEYAFSLAKAVRYLVAID